MKTSVKLFEIRLAVLAIYLATAGSVVAQDRFSIELRPGVNFPTRSLDDASLNTGFGLEGVFAYQLLPPFGVYAGWGWNRFTADESFAGPDVSFEETGYSYGIQFLQPVGQSNVALLVRGGVLSNHIEVEDHKGDIIGDSGHSFREGVGWQVEMRVDYPLGDRWSLVPSLRFRSLPRDIRIGAAEREVTLQYVSLGVGIRRVFPGR